MLSKDIDDLKLPELCDLLGTNTTELLRLLHQKDSDGYLLRDKKADVEMIQSAITTKNSEASPSLTVLPHM